MPKKKHIKLEDIKVKSFITSEHARKVMAGESLETNCDEGNCADTADTFCTCDASCVVTCAASCFGTCGTCVTCDTCTVTVGTGTDMQEECDC